MGADNVTSRGFIHNYYKDVYGKQYRIIQSSGSSGGVWIDCKMTLLHPQDIKKFCKELKRISKGKKK